MSFRLLVRRGLDGIFTAAWGTERWLSGSALAGGMSWRTSGRERVLVIAPHPDDEVAGCGGTLALHRRAGDDVTVCYVTDGRRSRSGGLDADSMARRRQAEAREAAGVLGAKVEWLGLPEGEGTEADLLPGLERVVRSARPTLMYVPSRIDFHPEHYRVARATADVLHRVADRDLPVRIYQVQVPLTRVLINVVTPVLPVLPDLRHLCAIYASQEGSLRSSIRLKRYAARAHHLPALAEEFWALPASGYVALHEEVPPRPLVKTFRGLRRLPWTDALAFRFGVTERRRLARLAVPST